MNRRWLHIGWVALFAMLVMGQAPGGPASPEPSEPAPAAADPAGPGQDAPAEQSSSAPATSTAPAASPAPAGPQPARLMPSGANVAVIRIEGEIYDFVLDSLRRRVERALDDGASLIVIELDTYGGMVTSALEISKFLKDPQAVPVPTMAWVHNKAYSAGIMIASACDSIVMSPSSTMGDCAPIVPGKELPPTERAKALSPVLEEFRDSARRTGADFAPYHAMCVLGVEVYLVEHKQTGQRRFVNQVDFAWMVQARKDTAASTGLLSGLVGGSSVKARDVGAPVREVATDQDLGAWKPVTVLPNGQPLPEGRVHDGSTLLTISESRAVELGLAQATIATKGAMSQYVQAAKVTTIYQTWSEQLAGFLTSPWVRGILVLVVMVGGYLEFQSPGMGVPGAIAAVALLALIGAPFVVGLAEVWHVIVFIVGLALLIIELLATPTFGLLGVLGILMMFAGLVLAVVPSSGTGPVPLPSPAMWDRLLASSIFTMGGMVGGIASFVVLAHYFGSIPVLNKLIFQPAETSESMPGGRHYEHVSGEEAVGAGAISVGATGRVSSTGLHPVGRAMFEDEVIDVVSVGGFIDPGTLVKVVEVYGNRIVVEKA